VSNVSETIGKSLRQKPNSRRCLMECRNGRRSYCVILNGRSPMHC